MNWAKVRIKSTGQVTEMVPGIAAQMVANGIAAYADTPQAAPAHISEIPTVEAAVLTQVAEHATLNYIVGPRSARR